LNKQTSGAAAACTAALRLSNGQFRSMISVIIWIKGEMKINLNDLEMQEFLAFRLTNEQRPCFGLDPVHEEWEEVEIKPGTTIYYDQEDVIRKVIKFDPYYRFQYTEFDTFMATRNRTTILPKTEKGKEKKITPTNIIAPTPSGCTVTFRLTSERLGSGIYAYNPRNHIKLPIDSDDNLHTLDELRHWITQYIETCPPDYFNQVDRMRTMPHRTIKYKAGDVFRFEIDRLHYGFALIIGETKKLSPYIPAGHNWNSLMTVPILFRFYELKTTEKELPIEEICSYPLLRADFMSDGDIIWGKHEIVGHKPLEAKDIDFPMHLSFLRENHGPRVLRFSWGLGTAIADKPLDIGEVGTTIEDTPRRDFSNSGVALSLPMYELLKVLNCEPQFGEWRDLLHPNNLQKRQKVYEWFGFPEEMDLDTFNQQHNGYTRQQYIDLIAANYKLL
jgi:hypothetical protein